MHSHFFILKKKSRVAATLYYIQIIESQSIKSFELSKLKKPGLRRFNRVA